MKNKFYLAILIGCLTFNISCSNRDNEDVIEKKASSKYQENKEEFINAKAYDKWVYYSFDRKSIVEVTDYKNDLNWDIAFHRGDVRLNGGESGIGKGEVIRLNTTDFANVTQAPTDGYTKDVLGSIITKLDHSTRPPIMIEELQPLSNVLKWVTYIHGGDYQLDKNVFVIKTAKGKYVKIQFTDNYGPKGKNAQDPLGGNGFVSFRYVYNTDGGSDF